MSDIISLRMSRLMMVFFALFVMVLQGCGGGGGGGGGDTPPSSSAPVITSGAAIEMLENSTATGYIASAIGDEGDTITYHLSEQGDVGLFKLDSDSGVLSFREAPDFEMPAGSDENSYVVEISASDGTHDSVAQRVTVSVTNVNEAPAFTSGMSANVLEGGTATGYTATAVDPEDDTITYSLSEVGDGGLFKLDSDSGVLSFQAAPELDSDGDNRYVVEISAADSTFSVVQSITITVVDVFDVTVSSADVKTIKFDWLTYPGATSYKLLANPDGVSGFTEVQGNLTGTSATLELSVHLTDWINASYLIEAHDGRGKLTETAAVTISSLMLSSIGYVKASDTSEHAMFGWAVSLSADGNTLAVGSRGVVSVFSRSGAGWLQEARLRASNEEAADGFGTAISLSEDGNTLVAGAYGEDSSARRVSIDGTGESDNTASDAGAVYLFSRGDNGWSQRAYVKASNTGVNDRFGGAVSLSADGNTLAVGARQEQSNATGISTDGSGESDNTSSGAGAVYLFSRSGTSWSQQAYVKASNTDAGDWFGGAVSLSTDGNMLAVGAHEERSQATGISTDGSGESDNAAFSAGAVYLFSRSGTSWSQQAYVKASNTDRTDRFGFALDLSGDGNTLAVGARQEQSNATGVSTDGTGESDNAAFSAGAVYLFSRSGTSWSQQAYVKASNTDVGDWFGGAVSLSTDGNMLAVGAYQEKSQATGISTDGSGESDNTSSGAGAVYLFSRSGTSWSQQAYVKASTPAIGDGFGNVLNLSGDGSMLAVGAFHDDSSASGIGGAQNDNTMRNAGAVYLY